MFIKKINLKNYYMFKDSQIDFCYPENKQNRVNILIGENGSGKTKILELIFCFLKKYNSFASSIINKEVHENSKNSTIELIDGNKQIISNENNHDLLATSNSGEKFYFVKSELLHGVNDLHVSLDQLLDSRFIEINEQFTTNSLKLITRAVIEKERNLDEPKAEIRKAKAIEWFNHYFNDTNIRSKLVEIEKLTENPLFSSLDGSKRFTFHELSSGEKQLYVKVASLILLEPHNSLILIDEPELSLHPEWQATFVALLKKIGSNNQFILATHSPYMVSNLSPDDHLIVLHFDKQKNIQVDYDPKFIERDINNTLDVMGYSNQLPPTVLELRKEYRAYFDRHQENEDEAIATKDKLLEYETLDSSFFQELEFLKAMRHD